MFLCLSPPFGGDAKGRGGYMKKLIFILAILLLCSSTLFGQLQVDWQQCFCSMDHDIAYDIAQTEGGYLVVGMEQGGDGQVTCSDDGGTWLLKIDNTGNLIWQECYYYVRGYRMEKAIGSPYYYLTGGTVSEPYPNVYSMWVGKMDSSGVFIWERTLGNANGVSDYSHYGVSTNDGGFIALVDIFSQGGDITNWYGNYDGWLVKLDSLGNKEWDFTVGSANPESVNGVTQTNDGGYLVGLTGIPDGITGNIGCTSFTPNYADAIIYKLDSSGNPEWHKCYGGSFHDGAVRVLNLNDGYLIAAYGESGDGDLTGSGWHGGIDIWLIRTDLSGEIIWQKCYGGSGREVPKRIFQTSDGGFMVFCITSSFDGDVVGNPSNSSENPSIWIFKVDSTGELLWQQCIGGHSRERVHGVIQLSDYNYAVAGEMFYSPSGDVNCSNFIYGSSRNYWVFGISDTTVNVVENIYNTTVVKVYPNPAQSFITFELPKQYEKSILEIIDVYGNILIKTELKNPKEVINVQMLKPGFYIYTLRAKGLNKSGKIVIRK